jgi:hypothetical protein
MDAAIVCHCGQCSHEFNVNARFAGRTWNCPNCGEQVAVVAPLISCLCPHCAHRFDVNARFLGRDWNCPNCGDPVPVVRPPSAEGLAATATVADAGKLVTPGADDEIPDLDLRTDRDREDQQNTSRSPSRNTEIDREVAAGASSAIAYDPKGSPQQLAVSPTDIESQPEPSPSREDRTITTRAPDLEPPIRADETIAARRSSQPPSEKELSVVKAEIAQGLLGLIDFIQPEHREKNASQLTLAFESTAPLDSPVWGDVAYMASIYGPILANKPLSARQKFDLLKAIQWAYWHSKLFRPDQAARVGGRLCSYLEANLDILDNTEASRVLQLDPIINNADPSTQRRLENIINRQPKLATEAEPVSRAPAATVPTRQTVPPNIEPQEWADQVRSIVALIRRHFQVLDRKHTDTNLRCLEEAEQDPANGRNGIALANLATLAVRNILYRHRPGNRFNGDQVTAAVSLARFGADYATGGGRPECRLSLALLEAMLQLRLHRGDPSTVFSTMDKSLAEANLKGNSHRYWDDLLGIGTSDLNEIAGAGRTSRETALAWVNAVADWLDRANWDSEALKRFLDAVTRQGTGESIQLDRIARRVTPSSADDGNGPLAFLRPAVQEELSRWVRNSELEKITGLLWDNRGELFTATSRALVHPSFQNIEPPRRYVTLAFKMRAPFAAARDNIRNSDRQRQELALTQFSELAEEFTFPEGRSVLHEWYAYAKALIRGPHTAASDWAEINKQGVSFEAAWNLAGFYLKANQPQNALETLIPGIISLRAPFSHLRFGLYCALQVIMGTEDLADDTVLPSTKEFLISNFCKLPIAHCYLGWLCLLKATKHNDLIEQSQKLATFQELEARPIEILDPGSVIPDREGVERIEKFRQYLVSNRLDDTWRIWINDFAARHRQHSSGWNWLAQACEKAGDVDAAEQALKKNVDEQIQRMERPDRGRGGRDDSAAVGQAQRIRSALINLFEFYKRQALSGPRVKQTFQTYYTRPSMRSLWDAQDPLNNRLINQIRPYLPDDRDKEIRSQTEVGQTSTHTISPNLLQEVSEVQDVQGLRKLVDRIGHAIAGIGGQTVVRQRRDLVSSVVAEVASLGEAARAPAELHELLSDLNRKLQSAADFAAQEAALRQLRPIVTACRRVFESFSLAVEATPTIEFSEYDVCAGLPEDIEETALVIRVTNLGPGDVEQAEFSATSPGMLESRQKVTVKTIPSQDAAIVGIPVRVQQPSGEFSCNIETTYKWGVIRGLKAKGSVHAHRFKFDDFLRSRNISGWEFPNPFVFDRALDIARDDGRIFKGRTKHLTEVRDALTNGRPPGTPFYFHGIRRCGKTSLLNKIASELAVVPTLAPVSFDLHGIRADQQEVGEIVYNFVNKKLIEAVLASGYWADREQVERFRLSQDHKYPLSELETTFRCLREASGARQPVFLVDEFQLIATPKTVALLDVLRRIYDLGHAWFIFSGLLKPEPLREACGDSSLLPLQDREVDFLTLGEVAGSVRDPISDYGINVPDSAIQAIFAQTAGYPNFVAKIAHMTIYRLNVESRNVLTPQDVEAVATSIVDDKANFSSTVLSRQLLSDKEINAAKTLVSAMPEGDNGLDKELAYEIAGDVTLQRLNDKRLFQLQDGKIQTRGLLLLAHLRKLTELRPEPPPVRDGRKRVGLFVDLENVIGFSRTPNLTEFGRKLRMHAEKFGQLMTAIAVADPRNLPNAADARIQLETANIDVSFVPREIKLKRELADQLLLDRINDLVDHWEIDLVVLAAGDKGYIFCIQSLLKKGTSVRLVGRLNRHIADEYKNLRDERRQYCLSEGVDIDFVIDEIDAVLSDEAKSVVLDA